MDPVVLITDTELIEFLYLLRLIINRHHTGSLRFAIDEGGLKVKVNGGTWTYKYGVIEKS